jgi:AcrR family transcriptional regulator
VPKKVPFQRNRRDVPRTEDSSASLDDILGAALRAFATHDYDGTSLRTINRNSA